MRARIAAAALAVALGLTACGGGKPGLSDAAYHQRATAICASYKTRIQALGKPTQLAQIAPYLAKALPILADTVDRLSGIRPPGHLADAYGRYLAAMQATRRRAFDLRDAAARSDGAAVERLLAAAAHAGSSTDALAREADLPGCVQGGA